MNKIIALIVLVICLTAIYFMLNINDPIIDSPCPITNISTDGRFTVSRIIVNNKISNMPKTNFLSGIGSLTPNEHAIFMQWFNSNVDSGMVNATEVSNGLEIIYYSLTENQIRNLNQDLAILLNRN